MSYSKGPQVKSLGFLGIPGGGGYSLYSNDRDDRRIWYFLGVVQAKSFKEIKMVFVRV